MKNTDMKTFREKQEARIEILKAELHYRKSLKDYEQDNYQSDMSDENLDQLNEAKQDYLVATIRLAEAERALNIYSKWVMEETENRTDEF